MTEVLEELFGQCGFKSRMNNRVRIRLADGEQDVWVIEPVGKVMPAPAG